MEKILITCPPMLGLKKDFLPKIKQAGYQAVCPTVTQTLTEKELIKIIPKCTGWIIGDDPATRKVFEAGINGKLRAAVKWGIGTDNVDFKACKDLSIPISNTPDMFGNEVADLALNYLLSLARETHFIDRSIRSGGWPKNQGISLLDKTVGLVGYGNIGRQTAKRLISFGLKVIVYDPAVKKIKKNMTLQTWPKKIEQCDFLIFTCSLNDSNRHMLDASVLKNCKNGVRIVNVARGPLIKETDLIKELKKKKVHSVALDVFETEPLPSSSFLRNHPLCVLGSHNASNTIEAVSRTNKKALETLFSFLKI